jgi:hypothetical protein
MPEFARGRAWLLPAPKARNRGGLFTARLAAAVRGWLNDHSDTSRAQRGAAAAFLIRVASAVLLYGSQVLFARWMGSFEFGVYVYVWTWVLLLGGLIDLGIATGAQRFIPEYTGKKQLDMLRGFLSGSRWLVLAMATAWAALAALGVWLFGAHLHAYEIMPLYIACAGLPLFTLGRLQDGMARSYDWINLALMPPYVIRSLLADRRDGRGLLAQAADRRLDRDARCRRHHLGHGDRANAGDEPPSAGKIEPGPKGLQRGRVASPRRCRSSWWKASISSSRMRTCCCCGSTARRMKVAVYYAAAKTLALVAFVSFSVSAATAHKFSEYHVAGNKAQLSAFLADSIKWTFWPSLGRHDRDPRARQADPLAVRPAIRRRLLPDVHPRDRPARARDRRARSSGSEHGGRAARLRGGLCVGVRDNIALAWC